MTRLKFFLMTSLTFLTILTTMQALAATDNYPNRPVTFLVPYPPGGMADASARVLAEVAKKYLGQPIIVENKIGASGQICADYLARQKPDGYTVGLLAYPHTHGEYWRYFRESTSTSKDFKVVAQYVLNLSALVVRTDDPFNKLSELVEYAKRNPGLAYGPGGGRGTMFHVFMTIFADKAGIKLIDVPTKGEAEVVTQILGGHLRLGVMNVSTCAPYLKSRKMKPLGLFADERFVGYPTIPTIKEQGYDLGITSSYQAAHVPVKTPDSIVARLREVLSKTCKDPDFISGTKSMDAPFIYLDGEALQKKINELDAVIAKVFKRFGYLK